VSKPWRIKEVPIEVKNMAQHFRWLEHVQ